MDEDGLLPVLDDQVHPGGDQCLESDRHAVDLDMRHDELHFKQGWTSQQNRTQGRKILLEKSVLR